MHHAFLIAQTLGRQVRRWHRAGGVRWFVGALCLLALGGARPAQAQDEGRYDVVLQSVPLDEALRHLLQKTDIDLAFSQRLVTDKWAYCAIEKATAEDALRCILHNTGLDFYRLSSGLYVLTEAPETQPRFGTLQGIVVDGATGAPLPNAHVLLADGSTGAVSNEAGRFLIAPLKPGYYRIATSYIGYRNRIDSVWVSPEATAPTRLSLDAEPFSVTPIIVDGMQWRQPSDSLGTAGLSQHHLLRQPHAGLPDVARSLSTLVGVRLSDGTADLHVQGGEAGEHQFRLDGAPVFIPVSIGGLVGPFSPFAISRVTVRKTGFGAAIGSQSTGVIQAEHALGEPTPHALDVQLDPMSINARLGFETDVQGVRRASFLLAGRTGLWDLYAPRSVRRLLDDWNRTDPFMLAAFRAIPQQAVNTTPFFERGLSTGDPGVGFLDVHAAGRIHFGPLRSLHVSTYWGRRNLDSDHDPFAPRNQPANAGRPEDEVLALFRDGEPRTRDQYVWSNSTSQVRYEAVLSGRLLASLQGRASLYRLRHDIVVEPLPSLDALNDETLATNIDPRDDNGNRIREYAVEARLDVAVHDRWHLETGLEPTYTGSRFFVQGTRQLPISHESDGWRVASFINNRFTLHRRLTLDAGARFTYLAAHQTVYAEPRLALRYDQPDGLVGPWSMRLATGLYRQYVNQFDVSSRSARALSATSRMWLGLDDSVSPPHTAHLAGELLFQPGPGWTVRLEGYYKQHLHLLAIDYAAHTPTRNDLGLDFAQANARAASDLPFPPSSQRTFLTDGEGHAYGSAVLVEKKLRRARLEARYEYSQALRSFGSFYEGAIIPTPWNEPHRLELALDWSPLNNLTLLGRWYSVWGRTWGFRHAYYDFFGAYRNRLLAARQANLPLEESDFAIFSIQDIIDHITEYRLHLPQEHRLPATHQLDVSVAYTHAFGATRVQARLDLLNVLDRNNVADWRLALDPDFYRRAQLLRREARHLLPFTPSLALRLSW